MSNLSTAQLLELAAHLGDVDAMRALAIDCVDPDGFEAWAWGFTRFGREAMVRATLVAAKVALPAWLEYQPSDQVDGDVLGGPVVAEAIACVAGQLAAGVASEGGACSLLSTLGEVVSRAASYVDEASGDATRVLMRSKAVSAAMAAFAMLRVWAWTDADALRTVHAAEDHVEAQARLAAGPAVHVVEAFAHACRASGIDAAVLRTELRASLLIQSSARDAGLPGASEG